MDRVIVPEHDRRFFTPQLKTLLAMQVPTRLIPVGLNHLPGLLAILQNLKTVFMSTYAACPDGILG